MQENSDTLSRAVHVEFNRNGLDGVDLDST